MSSSALYPPIMDTYQPSFVIDKNKFPQTIRIYCSISDFNSISSTYKTGAINPYYTQLSVRYQNTNKTALNKKSTVLYGVKDKSDPYRTLDNTSCPGFVSEIKICTLYKDSDDRYYVELSERDMDNHVFSNQEFYKIQLRFTEWGAETISTIEQHKQDSTYKGYELAKDWTEVPSWISKNAQYFSEWSKISLIKRIASPSITTPVISNNKFNSTTLDFVGTLTFAEAESDRLNNYELILSENNTVLENSGILYADNYNNMNELRYTFKTELKDKHIYNLIINYTTKNLFESSIDNKTSYNQTFSVQLEESEKLDSKIYLTTEEDPQRGSIKVKVNIDDESILSNYMDTYFMFRRADGRSNFEIWEDVFLLYVNTEKNILAKYGDDWKAVQVETELFPAAIATNYTFPGFYWYDCTVESGIWYKYGIQKISFKEA